MSGTIPRRERRKAWIYTVINPLLEGLRIEETFLARNNWTFRRYNRELEFIRPARILIGYKSVPNLEDLTASKPDMGEAIKDRETRREKLRAGCEAAFEALIAEPDFRQRVDNAKRESPGEARTLEHPAVPFYEVVAEAVVNHGGVPSHAGFYPFWSRFQSEFLSLRIGPAFEAADQAGREFRECNDDLERKLTQLRSALAEDDDIPWAPYDDAPALASR